MSELRKSPLCDCLLVASDGRVFSLDGTLKQQCKQSNQRGADYYFVSVRTNGNDSRYYTHRLVASAWGINYDNTAVYHRDGDTRNNAIDNLFWDAHIVEEMILTCASLFRANQRPPTSSELAACGYGKKTVLRLSGGMGRLMETTAERYHDLDLVLPARRPSGLCPGVSVTADGRVFRGLRQLKPAKTRAGYWSIYLTTNTGRRNVFVHRLVAEVWCAGYAAGLQVNHINSKRDDNRAENLEWVTGSENMQHAVRAGRKIGVRGAANPLAKVSGATVTAIKDDLLAGERAAVVAMRHGVAVSLLNNIRQKATWAHLWRPCDEALRAGSARGEMAGAAKLTALDVLEIRRLAASGCTFSGLARQYKVASPTIVSIVRCKTWRHLLPVTEERGSNAEAQ